MRVPCDCCNDVMGWFRAHIDPDGTFARAVGFGDITHEGDVQQSVERVPEWYGRELTDDEREAFIECLYSLIESAYPDHRSIPRR